MRLLIAAALAVFVVSPTLAASKAGATQFTGRASWYQCCKRTANGERFLPDGLTAAHRSLPFGTTLLVENLHNGKSVVVRINDRGPFAKGRILDLSRGAARKIGLIKSGEAKVRIKVIGHKK